MTYDYPQPDPAWDYYEIFESLQAAEKDLKALLLYISHQEEANSNIDAYTKSALANLIRDMEEILRLI